MAPMTRPETQRDQLRTIWDKVIGNGKPGLVDDVAEMKQDVQFIKGKLEGMCGGPGKKTVTLRRIAETTVTAVIIAGAIIGVVLLLTGRMSMDDLIQLVSAWKGGA